MYTEYKKKIDVAMEQTILSECEGSYNSRTYIFVVLNILGGIACFCTFVLMVLWALGLILAGPNTSPVLKAYVDHLRNSTIRFAAGSEYCEFVTEPVPEE